MLQLSEGFLNNVQKVAFIGESILLEDKDVVFVMEKHYDGFTLMEYLDGQDTLVKIEVGVYLDRASLIIDNLSNSGRYIYMKNDTMNFDLPSNEIKGGIYLDYKYLMRGLKEINRVISRDAYVLESIENAEEPEDETESVSAELPTAAKSFEDGGAREMEKYIERINKAVANGNRETYLLDGVHWVPRKEHVDRLTAAGYDIVIENVGDEYYVTASWDSAKETEGKIFYSEFEKDTEKREVSSDFFDAFK